MIAGRIENHSVKENKKQGKGCSQSNGYKYAVNIQCDVLNNLEQ